MSGVTPGMETTGGSPDAAAFPQERQKSVFGLFSVPQFTQMTVAASARGATRRARAVAAHFGQKFASGCNSAPHDIQKSAVGEDPSISDDPHLRQNRSFPASSAHVGHFI
jgi:type IV secretory pathway TrbL component